MDQQLLRDVVSSVLTQELLFNWQTYALMLAFGFLHKVTSIWLDRFVAKRAEHAATKADFDEILLQLRKTTNATEEVRTQISKIDWLDREWRTIRRLKLEELVSSSYSVLQLMQYVPLNRFDHLDQQPLNKLSMICSLYFPELMHLITALYKAFQEHAMDTIDCKVTFDKAVHAQLGEAVKEVIALHAKSWQLHYTTYIEAHKNFEIAAADLMTSIAQRSNTD